MIQDVPLCERGDTSSSRQNIFFHIAEIYDSMNLLISFGQIRSWRKRTASYLALRAGETGLDLGTGTADMAIALLETADPHAKVIGIDSSPQMLEQGRRKLQQRGLQGRIELRLGDAEHLDLPDNSVDGCCSAFLARNLGNLPQSLREMLRVVRPNGRVVCLEVSHPPLKIVRGLFHLFFYRCAPLFGALLGQRLAAYQYLPSSLKAFGDAPMLKHLMEECAWSDVHFHLLCGGIVSIHIGTKPEPASTGRDSAPAIRTCARGAHDFSLPGG
jgi:demethylmenaquinone methyltransferase / 2-methoxy-6-polyprenyl-1,4-benzoquinol methylase